MEVRLLVKRSSKAIGILLLLLILYVSSIEASMVPKAGGEIGMLVSPSVSTVEGTNSGAKAITAYIENASEMMGNVNGIPAEADPLMGTIALSVVGDSNQNDMHFGGSNQSVFATFDAAFSGIPAAWTYLGGAITSKQCAIMDNQGRRHVFARGGDNALWDNVDGSWVYIGGALWSAPYAAKDKNGKIHIVAIGGDRALWDFVFDTASWTGSWKGLGGSLKSMATAAMEPTYGTYMKIVAMGSDNGLWLCDFNVNDLTSYRWYGYGGSLTTVPFIMFDSNSRHHTFVGGADNSLWDSRGVLSSGTYYSTWYGLGGVIQGSPMATIEPGQPSYVAAMVKGGDGALWMADINVMNTPETCSWRYFGGGLSSEPFVTADSYGRIHTFVRGGDGSMWEHVFSSYPWNPSGARWIGQGGALRPYSWASPWALLDGQTYAYVIGADSAIWRKTYSTSAPLSSVSENPGKVNNPIDPIVPVEGGTGGSSSA